MRVKWWVLYRNVTLLQRVFLLQFKNQGEILYLYITKRRHFPLLLILIPYIWNSSLNGQNGENVTNLGLNNCHMVMRGADRDIGISVLWIWDIWDTRNPPYTPLLSQCYKLNGTTIHPGRMQIQSCSRQEEVVQLWNWWQHSKWGFNLDLCQRDLKLLRKKRISQRNMVCSLNCMTFVVSHVKMIPDHHNTVIYKC